VNARSTLLTALLAALLACGCGGDPDTGLVVEVNTDLAPTEVDAIRVRVWTSDLGSPTEWTFDLGGGGPSAELPGRLGLSPDDATRASPVRVEAAAFKGPAQILTREAALTFQPGAVLLLRLDLRAECVCRTCGAGTTCEEGARCLPIAKDVNALPRYGPRADAAARLARLSDACAPPHGGSPDGGAVAMDAKIDSSGDARPEPDLAPGSDAAAPEGDADADGLRDATVAPVPDAAAPGPDAPITKPDAAVAEPDAPADVTIMVPDAHADTAPVAPDASADQAPAPPDAAAPPPDAAVPDTSPPAPDAPPPDMFSGRPVGQGCAVDGDCALRLCVDHVCCASACSDGCMACSRSKTGVSDGTCAPITAGADPDDDCEADKPADCGYDGTCDGHGGCRLYQQDTRCAPPSCSGSSYGPPQFCSGHGACAAATPVDCGPYDCSLDGCLTTCAGDGECASTAYCGGGACNAKKGLGAGCAAPHECSSGLCSLGLCL
jgi:hypothetical protein